jgi:hypothetical protein
MNHVPPQYEGQLGFDLGDTPSTDTYQPNLDEIREDLRAILEAARRVTVQDPWDERTFRYNRVVFPQMSRWLPKEEAEQLCFEFAIELQRIQTLLAA